MASGDSNACFAPTYRNTKIGQIIGLYSKNEIKSQVYREYKESFKAKESKEELFEVE